MVRRSHAAWDPEPAHSSAAAPQPVATNAAAVSKSHTVETQHDEMIVRHARQPPSLCFSQADSPPRLPRWRTLRLQHDAQLDYYGKRLATCSSDRTIRIFEVVDGSPVGTPDILSG